MKHIVLRSTQADGDHLVREPSPKPVPRCALHYNCFHRLGCGISLHNSTGLGKEETLPDAKITMCYTRWSVGIREAENNTLICFSIPD